MTVQVSLSAPPGQVNEYTSEVIRPRVPRYCQLDVPGGATATWLEPGHAYGFDGPAEAWTVPPVPMTVRVPVPDRATANPRVTPETARVPEPDSAADLNRVAAGAPARVPDPSSEAVSARMPIRRPDKVPDPDNTVALRIREPDQPSVPAPDRAAAPATAPVAVSVPEPDSDAVPLCELAAV